VTDEMPSSAQSAFSSRRSAGWLSLVDAFTAPPEQREDRGDGDEPRRGADATQPGEQHLLVSDAIFEVISSRVAATWQQESARSRETRGRRRLLPRWGGVAQEPLHAYTGSSA
jgi:hypothetical protein